MKNEFGQVVDRPTPWTGKRIVTLTDKQELRAEAYVEKMEFTPWALLTLRATGPIRNERDLRSVLHSGLKYFHRRTGDHLEYMVVYNRGESGDGNWSCHVVFVGRHPKLKLLTDYFNKMGYPAGLAKMTFHDQAVRYFVKNEDEPGALVEHGAHNRARGKKQGRVKKRARKAKSDSAS